MLAAIETSPQPALDQCLGNPIFGYARRWPHALRGANTSHISGHSSWPYMIEFARDHALNRAPGRTTSLNSPPVSLHDMSGLEMVSTSRSLVHRC